MQRMNSRSGETKMKVLNPGFYRMKGGNGAVPFKKVERALDDRLLQIKMSNGNWWTLRRNGKTRRWKTDPNRIRIPYKYGFYGYGAIETEDFVDV
jgi:hypothetical protein